MDPEVALKNARRAADEVIAAVDSGGDVAGPAEALAESFQALDGWLAGGGFRPRDWE